MGKLIIAKSNRGAPDPIGLHNIAGDSINPATNEKLDELKALLEAIDQNTDELELNTENILIEAEEINLNTDELEDKVQSVRDQLDVLLSTRASESTLSAVLDAVGIESATSLLIELQAVNSALAAMKTTLDGVATEATLLTVVSNLTEIKTKLDSIVTVLGQIKSKTDNLDILLSSRAAEDTLQEVKSAIGEGSGTSVLLELQSILAELDVALSTRASEATLATVASKLEDVKTKLDTLNGTDFATQTTLSAIQTLIISINTTLDVNLSTRASETTATSIKEAIGEGTATNLLLELQAILASLSTLFADGSAKVKIWDGNTTALVSNEGELESRIIQNVKESTSNNSTDNLTAGGWFSGTGETTLGVVGIQVNFKCNETCTLYIEQSMDNSNWDFTDTWIVSGGAGNSRTFQATSSWFRIRVHNDGALTTTYLRLSVALCPIVEALPRALSYDGRLKVESTVISSTLALPLEIKYNKAVSAVNADEWQIAAQYSVPTGYNYTATAFRCHSETAGETVAVFSLAIGGTFVCSTNTFTDGAAIPVPQFGSGIGLMVTTTIGSAANDTITITYTNEVGTTGRTSTIVIPKGSVVGTNLDVALDGNDLGIRDITNITHSATGQAGEFTVVMYYAFFEILMASADVMYQAVSTSGSPIQFPSGTTLTLAFLSGTKTSYTRHMAMLGTLNPV